MRKKMSGRRKKLTKKKSKKLFAAGNKAVVKNVLPQSQRGGFRL